MIIESDERQLPQIISLLQGNALPTSDISSEKQKFWVFQHENSIIGCCAIEQYGNFALLRSLAVSKLFHGKGVGTALCKHIIEWSKEQELSALFLLTTTASSFFEKQAWIKVWRNAVPKPLQKSEEFSTICPSSSDCFMYALSEDMPLQSLCQFQKGYNCGQSVLSSYAAQFNLPEELALSLSSVLTAGTAFKGGVCGAVMGAYLVLGLKYGKDSLNNDLVKETTYRKIREFDKIFIANFNGLNCRELLGKDIGDENECNDIISAGLFQTACPLFVYGASNIVKQLLTK